MIRRSGAGPCIESDGELLSLVRFVRGLAGRAVPARFREDVTQDALVRLLPSLSQLTLHELRRLSHGAVRWAAVDMMRRERRQAVLDQFGVEAAVAPLVNAPSPATRQRTRTLDVLMLPAAEQRAVVAVLEGATGLVSIARVARVPRGHVRRLLKKGSERLRKFALKATPLARHEGGVAS